MAPLHDSDPVVVIATCDNGIAKDFNTGAGLNSLQQSIQHRKIVRPTPPEVPSEFGFLFYKHY
jgi:hypothetical protein